MRDARWSLHVRQRRSPTHFGGACTNDPTTLCAVDADCTVLACGVTDPDDCTAAGGVVRSESCCFGSPSGAFVDGAELF